MAIPVRHSDPSSIVASERTFFVTSSILGRRSLLQSARAADLFIQVIYHYRTQGKYRLHEFVVMPDHFHLLITVGDEMTIERAVQLVKGRFAFRAAREIGFRPSVWQKGFSEIRTMDAGAFARQRDYIRDNPVSKHIVDRADAYPFSSACPRYEVDAPPQRLKPVALVARGGTPEQLAEKVIFSGGQRPQRLKPPLIPTHLRHR
jgi:putative transposase